MYARALIMQGALLTERNAHTDALISYKKAATDHDTTLILEGLDQKALYLIACTHDSLAAARTAANAMRTPEYAGYLTKSRHNSLCMIAAEGYSAAGRADSALFFADKMILSGTSDSALYYWTLSTAKQYSGEFKKALEYEKKASGKVSS